MKHLLQFLGLAGVLIVSACNAMAKESAGPKEGREAKEQLAWRIEADVSLPDSKKTYQVVVADGKEATVEFDGGSLSLKPARKADRIEVDVSLKAGGVVRLNGRIAVPSTESPAALERDGYEVSVEFHPYEQ